MKTSDLNFVQNWLRARGLLNAQNALSLQSFGNPLRIATPRDSGRKTHLSRVIVALMAVDSEGLCWVDEFGIWPSSENRLIFTALRKLIGEQRPLAEAPGHFFSSADRELLEAILAVVLYFSWGAVVASANSDLVIRISHDEYICFYCKTDELRGRVSASLKEGGLPSPE